MTTSESAQLGVVDALLWAAAAGVTKLPAEFHRLPLADKFAHAHAALAALNERAAAGDAAAREFLASSWGPPRRRETPPPVDHTEAAGIISEAVESLPAYPGGFSGRGVVTCAGGPVYQTCAWVLFALLRKLGCTLPIECWYAGSPERDVRWQAWAAQEFGVVCRDALAHGYIGHRFAPPTKFRGRTYPRGTVHGYALKPFAVQHSSFREVLFLDADNTPQRDPTFLFETTEYIEHGALFWPDLPGDALAPDLAAFGMPGPQERVNWESGQIVLDKERAWQPLWLTGWFNAQATHFYKYAWGDCGTWQAAWKRLAAPWAMPSQAAVRAGEVALVQHDFAGQPLFFHRIGPRGKWRLDAFESTPGYEHNALCLAALADLAERWGR